MQGIRETQRARPHLLEHNKRHMQEANPPCLSGQGGSHNHCNNTGGCRVEDSTSDNKGELPDFQWDHGSHLDGGLRESEGLGVGSGMGTLAFLRL